MVHPWVRPSPSFHASPSLQKARSFTNFRKAGWEVFTAETDRIFADIPLPTSCSAGEKVFRHFLVIVRKHHIPCGYVRDYCGPLPDVERPPSMRETSAALTTLPSSGTSARKRKTSGDPCWNPPTALPMPSATGLFCTNWVERGRIPHLTSQLPSMVKPTPARR